MRVLLQRVKHAQVSVDHQVVGKIQQGFLLLVGISQQDDEMVAQKLAKKCVDLRVFEDENGKMNKGIQDIKGEILSISQFTLYADCRRGKRPGFSDAAQGEIAKPLYEYFNAQIEAMGISVETGIFGADMKVELCNDGPVTIMLDSDTLC